MAVEDVLVATPIFTRVVVGMEHITVEAALAALRVQIGGTSPSDAEILDYLSGEVLCHLIYTGVGILPAARAADALSHRLFDSYLRAKYGYDAKN
jgi:hypothetical protein